MQANIAEVEVPISRLAPNVKVSKEELIVAATLLKWISKERSISDFVSSFPLFERSKNACNRFKAASLAPSIDG